MYRLLDRCYAVRRTALIRSARRRIFIDCGANTCTVLRGFIKRYPNFEFFAFGAQPELAAAGEDLSSTIR